METISLINFKTKNQPVNIQKEKREIIEALQNRNEEWLIIAIKKLLDLDSPFSEEHKSILQERMEAYKKNPSDVISLEELKKNLRKEDKID